MKMFHFSLSSLITILLALQVASWRETNSWKHGHYRHHPRVNHKIETHHSNEDIVDNDIPTHHQPEIKKKGHSVCRTEECFKVAGELWQNMNRSVDPCVDFYEYACGRWSERHPVPPTEKNWEPMLEVRSHVEKRVRDILEESTHPDDILPVKLAKKFYRSCLNLDAIEEMGYNAIESMLAATGGWPMIMEQNEWNPKEYTWQHIEDYYVFHTLRFAIFRFDVTIDRNMTKLILGMGGPQLPASTGFFPRSVFYDDGKYGNYTKAVAMVLAESRDSHILEENIEKDIADIIEFERNLKNYSMDEDEQEEMESVSTILELQKLYDREVGADDNTAKINWARKIAHVYDSMGLTFDESQEIQIMSPGYFLNLAKVLKNTSPRTLVNFIQWSYISDLLEYTTEQMKRLRFKLTSDELGIKEEKPRWKTCVEETELTDGISYQFVNKYFNKNMKNDAENMIEHIKKAMEKKLTMADWLDKEAKDSMLQKIYNLKIHIGYPEWYDNKTRMNSVYSGLVIGRHWFDNALNMKKFSRKAEFKQVGQDMKSLMDDSWPFDPITVNAGYLPTNNLIVVPAADFYTPIYAEHRTETLNWGAIGMIIAHEISHGVDPFGRKYDKNGDMYTWKNETDNAYTERQQCFIKQYDEYYQKMAETLNGTFEGNGEWSVGENVADTLGQANIFSAYSILKEEQNVPLIPGFEDLTDDHLFFLSFANLWCTATTPEYDELSKGGSHATAKYRVLAPIQNSENFARIFKCPKGSPMNPETKCKIF